LVLGISQAEKKCSVEPVQQRRYGLLQFWKWRLSRNRNFNPRSNHI